MNARIVLLIPLLLLGGCALTGGRSPASHYYVLPAPRPTAATTNVATTIALAPVRLPRYLDHPQIVTLDRQGRARLAEFHRWAEPLNTGFTRVLATALARQLHESRIVLLPARNVAPAWTLALQVHELEIMPERLKLLAEWRLLQGQTTRVWQREEIERRLADADYAAIATGLSGLCEELARRIARTLAGITAAPAAGSGGSVPGPGPAGTTASP
ncbi:conserved hypothetical protein [Methylomarinovum caldicuralii]|uniref:ABC-type transport auxiliary lipoprotein component domain-containing protein n=1 Tax=Methylomarinovum caldicuralii TaxID=438856 RepID=A0AAU9C160_9GAMM|nr:PqiC family protein [Methylomarinovum caldicuralii]BCX80865.1 conserved hypothetical protein [Methylomarinovum caldicuralii]